MFDESREKNEKKKRNRENGKEIRKHSFGWHICKINVCNGKTAKSNVSTGKNPQPVRFAGLLWLKALFAGLL
jgi:hypothetical protein